MKSEPKQYTLTFHVKSNGAVITCTVWAENEEQAWKMYQPDCLQLKKVEEGIKNKKKVGRKAKELPESVEQVRERMKTESAENLAKEYGIGRRTLFKLLKEAKELEKNAGSNTGK